MTRYARKYRRIARQLSRLELMAQPMELEFSAKEVSLGMDLDSLEQRRGTRRFLEFYGIEGIELALERYGMFPTLRSRGWRELRVETRADDDRHTMVVQGVHERHPEQTHLVEFVVRRDRLVPDEALRKDYGLGACYEMLTVDWLTLRDPTAEFTARRPQLPGQDAPGLGLGEQVLEMMYRIVERLNLDGMLSVGEYVHNAAIYRRELKFFDVSAAARCRALEALLFEREKLSLAQATWAVEWGLVRNDEGPMLWRGEAQVRAFCPDLKRYFTASKRRGRIEERQGALSFALDRGRFWERWEERAAVLEGRAEAPSGEGDSDG